MGEGRVGGWVGVGGSSWDKVKKKSLAWQGNIVTEYIHNLFYSKTR